jgi:hypothetical protein
MYLIGGEVDCRRSQVKTRRMSHHLWDKNQQENREELIDAFF